MMSSLYLLFLLVPLVSAQTYRWGSCPKPMVQPNFNVTKYLGRWFEIEKLPASFERGNCIEANYNLKKDGTIQVLNSQVYEDNKTEIAEGTAVVRDPREAAKLGVSFSYFSPYSPYWVLTTDYESLSVVYSCTNILHIFHIEFAWILTRERFPPAETVSSGKELLTKEGINLCGMTATVQTGCED